MLVVDDSLVMRRLHKAMLVEHGVAEDDVYEAGDGNEALAIAEAQTIGLFLVDWNMPHLNGLEFVKLLRAHPTYARTPVVMVTSEAAKYNVIEAIQAGVSNYIIKPIKGPVLLEKITRFLPS